jgi:hypothetical protein
LYIDGTVALIPAKNPTPSAIIASIEINLALEFAISLKVFFNRVLVNVLSPFAENMNYHSISSTFLGSSL